MPKPYAISPQHRRIAALMLLATVSLAVEAALHVSGAIHHDGNGDTYAGYSEAVIAVVLLFGTIRLARRGSAGYTAALVTTVFAIAGFILGLTYTVPSGYVPDIAYHVTVLPILIIILVLLVRAGRAPAGAGQESRRGREASRR